MCNTRYLFIFTIGTEFTPEGSLPGVVVTRVSTSAAVKEKATPPKRQRPSRKHLSWIRILPHSSAQTYTRKHAPVHAHPTNSPSENTEEADSGREKPNVHVLLGELLAATSNAWANNAGTTDSPWLTETSSRVLDGEERRRGRENGPLRMCVCMWRGCEGGGGREKGGERRGGRGEKEEEFVEFAVLETLLGTPLKARVHGDRSTGRSLSFRWRSVPRPGL